MLLPRQTADRLDLLAVGLIDHRLHATLRHRDGLTYVVDHLIHPVGEDEHDLTVVIEPPEAKLVPAVVGLVSELRHLLREGVSDAELEVVRDRVSESRLGRATEIEERRVAVIDQLLGVPAFRVDEARLAAVALTDLNRYLADLESDLLFVVPDDPRLDLTRLGVPETTIEPTATGDLPPGEVFRPPLLAQAFSAAARQATVVLTETGVSARLEGLVQTVRWDEVAGLAIDDKEDELLLHGLDGAVIPLASSAYRGGRELLRQVRRRVPQELTFRRSALLDHSS